MKLILDGVSRNQCHELAMLKYWERGWVVLRLLRDTPLGFMEVGRAWECPAWLFERVWSLVTRTG